MNAPPMPEPVALLDGAALLQRTTPLRRYPIRDGDGFAVEVSSGMEAVYLLGLPDGSEIPVPCRLCGDWNPATLSGRHFFFAHEPDAALVLTSVRKVHQFIGRLAFPSGWAASPWLSAPSAKQLMKRLDEYSLAFLQERLERRPSLSRTVTR